MTFTNWVLSFFGKVHCDRCHETVEGFLPDAGGMSAGVYVGWRDCMDIDEWIVCDDCMWADPRYIAIHGKHQ
jgi:hypothetical protein